MSLVHRDDPIQRRMEFIGDRVKVLEAVCAACKVSGSSSEWNRGPLSLPGCPKALRREYAALLGDTPDREERGYLENPLGWSSPDPFGDRFRKWMLLTGMPEGQAPELREPSYVPPWADPERNQEALSAVRDATSVRIENGSPTRAEGEWVFDLVARDDGWRLMNAAHDLAHWNVNALILGGAGKKILEPGKASMVFAKAVAETGLSSLTGVDSSTLREAGVSVLATEGLQFADGWIPIESLPETGRAVVFATYRVEPPPKSVKSGDGGWLEVNRWCCAPTTVAYLGFACMDVVMKCPVVRRGTKVFVHVPHGAMHPMPLLDGYMACAELAGLRPMEPGGAMEETRGAWPCRMCMALPSGKGPRVSPDEESCPGLFQAVERASEWFERKSTGRTMKAVRKDRAERRASWKAVSSKSLMVSREMARARKWLERGDPGKYAEIVGKCRRAE